MRVIIDIDENLYTRLFDNGVDNYDDAIDMAKAIRKGTPLPKGHGDLIDRSKLEPDVLHDWNGYEIPPDYYSQECIDNAPIVVPATGGEK